MLMSTRPGCGDALGDRDDGVDAVGAGRARVDPARDAVAQQHSRAFRIAARMRMDVDQAGHDELAARVERCGRLGGERGLDGRDSAGRDADVANGVEPQRRIDDAPAFDDEVVAAGLRAEPSYSREQRRARGGVNELASIHGRPPMRRCGELSQPAGPRHGLSKREARRSAARPGRLTWPPSLWTNGGDDDEKLGGDGDSGCVCRFGLRARSGAAASTYFDGAKITVNERARADGFMRVTRHARERRASRGDAWRSRGA